MPRRLAESLLSTRFAWAFAVLLAAVSATLATWWGAVNQDEGWYLYAAQLVHDGLAPYRDFFYTQGPTMPYVYGALSRIWAPGSPLHGLLGGRLLTLGFSCVLTALAMALAARLAPAGRRGVAAGTVFAALACCLYHVYFTTMPKTYALGGAFAILGLLLADVGFAARGGVARALAFAASAFALALASGTRISLVLLLGTTGLTALVWGLRRARSARGLLPALWFGLGGLAGLFLTYGFFVFDPASLRGLLAAQAYHAARGGFDPFFALGSVSRLARGYWPLGAVMFAAAACLGAAKGAGRSCPAPAAESRPTVVALILGFFAVFALQLSAPFPYDDYQVPVMPLLAVAIAVGWARVSRFLDERAALWLPVLLAGLGSFSAPQLQEWSTDGQDRFWTRRKEMTELAKLRLVGWEIERLDPGGKELLTQDVYLAVETGRRVPRGFEMGPFSLFGSMDDETAAAIHVLNPHLLEQTLAAAPAKIAAFSGYGFAVNAPTGTEFPFDDQHHFWSVLKRRYDLLFSEPCFGQNSTTLLVLRRKDDDGGAGEGAEE